MTGRSLQVLFLTTLFATSGTLFAAESAGTVKSVRGGTQLQRGAQTTPLKVGDSVEAKDRIMTDEMGSVGITLSDDTLISVGPRSALTIEEFAFNPTTQAGALSVNVVSGTLRMVTGLIARQSPSAVRINTPNAAIGVRGTDFIVEVPAP
jgi:hypothetical protein